MTSHRAARAVELLARSHHSSHSISHYTSHYGSHYSTHSPDVSFGGAWWMIPLGTVLGVAWVFVKRRFRSA